MVFFALLYMICAGLLAVYAASTLLLLVVYWRHRHDALPLPTIEHWPVVAVQLPIYNERLVVERLLNAVAGLDYPRDRLIVQVLDDSTDETSAVVARRVEQLRQDGHDIRHVQRSDRDGYKAGALQHGLSLLDCELVAVLDADFLPAPDFLRRTVPYLVANPSLGMVQTRWGHLNPFDNALTQVQTLALDGHFVVEQTARNRAGWFMNFSGSGGLWRVACIHEAGGWRATTLTEDLDLSYRAQLAGWRFLYLPDVVVPAEVPPQMAAFKQQQARWAQGSTRTLAYMLRPLWRAPLTWPQRMMATLHLCQYIPHPLMLMLLLLTPPLILTQTLHKLPLGALGLFGLGPPLLYVVSQRALYPDWKRRLLAFPALLVLGTGMAWNNTLAVVAGLRDQPHEFRRTPKFVNGWAASHYALALDHTVWGEATLAIYALVGLVAALYHYPALAPYLALYSMAFGLIAGWSLRDQWLVYRERL